MRQYFQALVSEETNKCTEVFAFFLPRRCADQNSNGEEKRGIFAFQLIPRSYAKVHREERKDMYNQTLEKFCCHLSSLPIM